MLFEELLLRLTPKLKGIAVKVSYSRTNCLIEDEDDLIQIMEVHLWDKWQRGEIEGRTDSYLLQSCWFHLQNYLRTTKDRVKIISMDEPLDPEEKTVIETIHDNSPSLFDLTNYRLLVEKIKIDGLTKREKEVFALSLGGHTLREIGKRLNISFVRVSKIQNNIRRKWGARITFLKDL